MRDPRRLGPNRVNVQIALGDLADPFSMRHAMRGVDTIVHLAATIRDQPAGTIEELNGLATVRLLRAAERAGVERFVFFSAMGATGFQRRASSAPRRSPSARSTTRPRDDRVRAVDHLQAGRPLDHPARAVLGAAGGSRLGIRPRRLPADLGAGRGALRGLRPAAPDFGSGNGAGDRARRFELAGPETLDYDEIVEQVLEASGRERPAGTRAAAAGSGRPQALELLGGSKTFATWEEAELMEVPMTSERGPADAEGLGVTPRRMADVLGGG